jgi:hypothetical protein
MTYNLTLHDNHAIFETEDGSRILVDTGVPYTFHTSSKWNFEGTNYTTHENMGNINVATVSTLAGTNITTLLGGDIMSRYKIAIDYHNLTISFESLNYEINEGEQVPLQKYQGGYLLLPVQINGQSVLGYLDSGAKISYISTQLINGLIPNNSLEQDYYIGMGAYETNTFNTNATLSNGFTYEGKFGGQLPAQIASSFFGGQRQAIIGSDFFLACKKVWIDYSNSCIYIVS